MRTFTKTFFLLLASVVCLDNAFGQKAQISRDSEGNKVITGFTSKAELASDTAFAWYAQNQKGYTPHAGALQVLKNQKDSVHFLVFGGTWCHDTQFILPKFYAFADAAGVAENRMTTLGVDRDKKTVFHLAEAFGVVNVPTIIVLKEGREIGRVVEYGKYGMVDKELGEILSKKNQ